MWLVGSLSRVSERVAPWWAVASAMLGMVRGLGPIGVLAMLVQLACMVPRLAQAFLRGLRGGA